MTDIVPTDPPAADAVPARSVPPPPRPLDQLRLTLPPAFDSLADERRHRRERLAAALRVFDHLGHEDGVGGHLTARDPEFTDHYWVNPFGVPFRHVTAGGLVLVNEAGQVVEGAHHVNQAAFAVHAAVHRARPEVVAVAQVHSAHGSALAALGEPLEPVTREACAFYEDHAVSAEYAGVLVDEAGGRRIAAALGPHKALVLRNHGLLTVGDSVDAAAWWFIAMDRACGVQLAAKAAGEPVPVGHEDALLTRAQLGGDLVAWINYQPLHQRVAREQPDLFD